MFYTKILLVGDEPKPLKNLVQLVHSLIESQRKLTSRLITSIIISVRKI